MLDVRIPRRRFWTADYPNLDPAAEGQLMPLYWGEQTNVLPTCIDTTLLKYKLMDNYGRAIKSIDEIRSGEDVLAAGVDYQVDLPNAEFQITGTPILQANATYWFTIESDYAINGTDYLRFAQGYAYGHKRYDIDGAGVWTEDSNYSLFFLIFVKDTIDGSPYVLIDNFNVDWGGWNMLAYLRDAAARTRIGQKFVTPAAGGPWYLYQIAIDPRMPWGGPIGEPSADRITKIAIFSAIKTNGGSEVQVGTKSYRMENYPGNGNAYFPQRAIGKELRVDFKAIKNPDESLMENVADILKDSYVTVLDGEESALDAAAFAALKTARPEPLSVGLDSEMDYRQFIEKLEAGQLFKFIPTLDWSYTVLYSEPGEPDDCPHFRDEHFIDFKCLRKLSSVFSKIKLSFGEDQETKESWVVEAISNIARYCYWNEKTLELETYFKDSSDAADYAEFYSLFCEHPLRLVEFTTASSNTIGLIPWQKIKVTRSRADASGGILNSTLFRIMSIKANPLTGQSTVIAALDEQTYIGSFLLAPHVISVGGA